MLETLHRKKHLTSFQFIILGFAGIIFAGALLLMLPISSASGTITIGYIRNSMTGGHIAVGAILR